MNLYVSVSNGTDASSSTDNMYVATGKICGLAAQARRGSREPSGVWQYFGELRYRYVCVAGAYLTEIGRRKMPKFLCHYNIYIEIAASV